MFEAFLERDGGLPIEEGLGFLDVGPGGVHIGDMGGKFFDFGFFA